MFLACPARYNQGMPWSDPLASPIVLKDGRVLITLRGRRASQRRTYFPK
jgi:hypothetical protein